MNQQKPKGLVWLVTGLELILGFLLAFVLIFAIATIVLHLLGKYDAEWTQHWAELGAGTKLLLNVIGLVPVAVLASLLWRRRKVLVLGMAGYVLIDILAVLMDR